MNFIQELLETLNKLSATSPFVGGVVAVAVTGLLGFFFFKAPKEILRSISTMVSIRFTVNNGGWGNNQIVYSNVAAWFSNFNGAKLTRTYTFEAGCRVDGDVGPGDGRHYLFYCGIPLVVVVVPLDSSGSEIIKKEISIRTLFIFRKKFFEIIDKISKIDDGERKEPTIRTFKDGAWVKGRRIAERRLDTIVMEGTVKEDIIRIIDEFLSSREWYRVRGIPYKLTILLYGPPGTGKTSLMKAIAYHYQFSIAPVPLHSCSDVGFVNAVNSLPPDTIMLMEDIDTDGSVKDQRKTEPGKADINLSDMGLNLSTIINTIDGVADLDGQIIFMSTNHPEKLDSRLYRCERVDKTILVDYLSAPTVKKYTKMVYPDLDFVLPYTDVKIPGSKLQSVFKENKHNPEAYLDIVTKMLRGELPVVEELPKL